MAQSTEFSLADHVWIGLHTPSEAANSPAPGSPCTPHPPFAATDVEFRRALAQEEFSLVYQPIVDPRTCRFTGVEALLRWHHPTLGDIPPSVFIDALESSETVHEIGMWIFETAFREIREWVKGGLKLSVNVCAFQLEDQGFHEALQCVLAQTQFPPTSLVLELTERSMITSSEAGLAQLQALRQRGVRLALDDFGTGFSSLSCLLELPVDSLKIDGSFAARIPLDPQAATLTRNIVNLGHSLDFDVVLEGVEGYEQAAFATSAGCDDVQGFWYSLPLSSSELYEALDAGLG